MKQFRANIRKHEREITFVENIFVDRTERYPTYTAGLRARCMAYIRVCVYVCVYPCIIVYNCVGVSRRVSLLHRRSIKRWRRVEYFDTVCVYSRLLRTSHFRILGLLQHVCVFISFANVHSLFPRARTHTYISSLSGSGRLACPFRQWYPTRCRVGDDNVVVYIHQNGMGIAMTFLHFAKKV